MMSSSNDTSAQMWQIISEKLKPFLTRDDFVNLDKEDYTKLIKRLKSIATLTEKEYTYASANRDLILIRMGLIHTLPDVTDDMMEDLIKQLAIHLATKYYEENIVQSWKEAEEKVLNILSEGFMSKVTMGLNPINEIETFRKYLNSIGSITEQNKDEVISKIDYLKDKLMEVGISGVTLRKLTDFAQKLKKTKTDDLLYMKSELLDATFEWEERIKRV